MDVRMQASEARHPAGRLEELARAMRDRGGDHCCRDWRAIEHRLIAGVAEADQQARVLEAEAQRRS